jgi:hypothetical protein
LVPGSHAIERFLEQARQLISFGDIANAAAFLKVLESSLSRWYYDYLERRQRSLGVPVKPIRQLGIDELSLKKHRQFVAVIIDESPRVGCPGKPRRNQHYCLFRRRAKPAACWPSWRKSPPTCRRLRDGRAGSFGDTVRVTIDRFQVMKNFQEHLTDARRQIQRELAKGEAQGLKGTRRLWVTNRENLGPAQQAGLAHLKERFPYLPELVECRETLRQLFEDRTIADAATGRIG